MSQIYGDGKILSDGKTKKNILPYTSTNLVYDNEQQQYLDGTLKKIDGKINKSVKKSGDQMTGELVVPNIKGFINGCALKYENGCFYIGYDDEYIEIGGDS